MSKRKSVARRPSSPAPSPPVEARKSWIGRAIAGLTLLAAAGNSIADLVAKIKQLWP